MDMEIINDKVYKNEENLKQRIYSLMLGALNIEEYPVKESRFIDNEFAENMYCGKLYQEIFSTNLKLCNRLGVDEDVEVETIISNGLDISKHLSMKMYDYGMLFSQTVDVNKDLIEMVKFYNDLSDDKKELFINLLKGLKKLLSD